MTWEAKDFSKMKVNVFSMDGERNCLKENEWLQKVFYKFIDDEELNGLKGVTINQLVRVILVCYDPNSPLVVRIQDIKQRKIEAFTIFETKIYKDSNRFSGDVEDIIMGRNEKFNRMVLQFLKCVDNLAYCSMSYYLESYYDLLSQLQRQEGKDLAQILILIEKIEAQVKKKSKEMFVNDENLANYVASDSVYEEADALTPEIMAKKIKAMKDGAN